MYWDEYIKCQVYVGWLHVILSYYHCCTTFMIWRGIWIAQLNYVLTDLGDTQ